MIVRKFSPACLCLLLIILLAASSAKACLNSGSQEPPAEKKSKIQYDEKHDQEKHHHHQKSVLGQSERVEDGAGVAQSQRDAKHYGKDGQHNIEYDQEAILGSYKRIDELEAMSPEQAKIALAGIVQQMDVDHDSFISKSELTDWVEQSFRSLAREESEEKFEDADEDGDGFVTWREHVGETYGIYEDADMPREGDEDYGETLKWLDEDKTLFAAADLNSDSRLTRNEYFPFSHPEEHPSMHQHVVARTLQDKDTDGDGKISLAEYLGDSENRKFDKEWETVETEKFNLDYDKNGDRQLDSVEILKWIIPDNREMAAEEAEHLLAETDDNKDGRLSADEFLAHHDMFVGGGGGTDDDDDDADGNRQEL